MDLFGTKWKIVETRKHLLSKELDTEWKVYHKVFGLFWSEFCQDTVFAYEITCTLPHKTLRDAYLALRKRLGDKKFDEKMTLGLISIESLKPFVFGNRILRGGRVDEYELHKGHYETVGVNEFFITHEIIYGPSSSPKELIMKANLAGLLVDNECRYDSKSKQIDDHEHAIGLP